MKVETLSVLLCELCNRITSDHCRYCRLHEMASAEVPEGFENWKKAFVSASLERYLESILMLKETGDAARQIAKHLLKQSK